MQQHEVIAEMLEPVQGFDSKLEWLAYWLDATDEIIIRAYGDFELGHQVQDDLRRWARELREESNNG